MAASAPVAPRELADSLLSRGIPWVTLAQAASELGTSEHQATSTLSRLRDQGRIFSPVPGLYFPVPPHYRTWCALPATDFVDPMMKAVGGHYYVGFLSAAELHGAAHQRPQVFQVVTDKRLKDRDFGRVKVRFYPSARVDRVPAMERAVATGYLRVSTPAATALDLTSRPMLGGGLSNVATVLSELAEENSLSTAQILEAAAVFPESCLRRVGYLMELIEADVDTDELHAALPTGSSTLTLLDPKAPRRGRHEGRWGLIVNQTVEPDL